MEVPGSNINNNRAVLTEVFIFMCPLHEAHEMNSYRCGRVCLSVRLSVRMIQADLN